MAEQEACAELVEKASDEATIKESGSTVHGESLLLPLLQGLLDKPENDQPTDSGTESGEDLRSGLILEVQSALDKLSASLKSSSSNIAEERRDSLLQLVNRLQAGLTCQLTPSSSSAGSSERRSSLNQGRFSKRKQRANRHTVGVSSEELEDARRLMEEIAFRDNGSVADTTKDNSMPLQKQNSEGSVLQTPPFKPLSKTSSVKNVTAKPFISSNVTGQSQSGTSSTVDTPSETSGSLEFLVSSPEKSQSEISTRKTEITQQPVTYHHSKSLELQPQLNKKRPLSEAISLDYSNRDVDLIAIQKAVTQAAAIKQLSQMKSDVSEDADEDEEGEETESDDEAATVKSAIKHETVEEEPQPRQPSQPIEPTQPIPPILPTQHVQQVQPQPDLILQTNPIYNQPQEHENNLSDNDEYPISLNEKANRFYSKKLRMKRANTIDIPKPLKYYECDDEDSENEDLNTRRNSYLALRGPIHVGKLNVEKRVPEFEPKTASDKKFMAFLGRNTENDNVSNAPKMWSNQQQHRNIPNWGNRFGNIKNNFEKVQASNSINSARNFWKSADDSLAAGKISHIGPKISRQSARNLQQMFEEKQKQSQQQSNANINDENNIVTGYLKVDTKSNKNIKVMTQPNPVNKFSHAPLSAFKPVGKKIEAPPQNTYLKPKPLEVRVHNENTQPNENRNGKTSDSPMYLYSPKPLSPEDASPVNVTPWQAGRSNGESRVLSLVASKFENHVSERAQPDPAPFRKMSKEKITIPPALMQQQNQPQEKLTAPYLVKSVAQNSSVRKLSGQYDSMGNRDSYPGIPNNKYQYDTKPRMFVPGENYTIKYDNPTIAAAKRPEPKIYNAEYTITQQHYAVPQPIEKSNTQFAPVEPVQNQQEIYHKPQYNRRQSYEQVQIHNQLQQQQIHSNIQQRRDESSPVIQPESLGHRLSYTQPEIYNEPTVQNEDDHQYTSSFQFQPQIKPKTVKINDQPDVIESSKVYTQKEASKSWDKHAKEDYYSRFPGDAEREETERVFANDIKTPPITKTNEYSRQSSSKSVSYKRQTSQENVKEYTPVSSKVMTGPVSQQAVTIQQNAPKTRDQYDMEFNLKSTLQKFSAQLESKEQQRNTSSHYQKFQSQQRKQSFEKKSEVKEDIPPPQVVYNNVKQRPSLRVNDQPLESLEINERGESVLTSKFHIPVKQTMLSPPAGSALSKSESWHQICISNQNVANKPSPRASPNSRAVTRSKSSHSLDVPKLFEAGMSKTEMSEKRKTMEAYFGAAPQTQSTKTDSKKVTSSINRVKTSQKVSTQRQNSTGLCRSKTLPDIVCLDKLDDNSIDAIFEDLFNSST